MTRTNKFLHGVGWGYLNQFVMAAAGLYLTRFYLDRLGGSFYGLWIVGLQILAYLSLMDLGLVALLPRETAYALGHDKKELPRLLGETLSLTLLQTPLLGLVAVGVWYFLPNDWADLRGPLAYTFTAFVLMFPLRAFGSVLQGLQDFKFVGLSHFVTWALGTIASVAGLYFGLGLYAIALGWFVTEGGRAVSAYFRLRWSFPETLPRHLPRPSSAAAKDRLTRSIWITVSQVSQNLLSGTDILVLGKILGPTAVVAYACTSKLVQILVNQPLMITHTALPGLAELRSSKDLTAIRRVTEAITLIILLSSGAIAAVLVATNGGFVRWWVGDSQYGGNTLTVLLLANMVWRHYATALVFSIFCFGHEKRLAGIGVADGLGTLVLSVALTPIVGPVGPMIGSLISALFSVPALAIVLARDLQMTVGTMLRPLLGWAWRFALTLGIGAAILYGHYSPKGPLMVGAVGIAMAAAYGLLMIPVIRSSVLLVYLQPAWDRTLGVLRRRAQ